mmetsp:Transcript_15437/g.27284  ORF Transcript_15437/g.27284 Transcript_15437/m.27284 type:complete len:405 (+) Transcript_15437:329-1543(+)
MTDIPGAEDAWTDNCDDDSSRYPRCREYAATERVSFCAACFFAFMAMVSGFMPPIHDHGWDIKAIGYISFLIATIWMPNSVVDNHGYVWFARVGSFFMIVLQQIILVDFAYTLNDKLYNMAGDTVDDWGSGHYALLGLCLTNFAVAITGIVLMFVFYTSGCDDSTTFVSLTLIFIVILTALQITSDPEHGHNLLVTSVVAVYITYLTYVAVSSNPNGDCNPNYSDDETALSVVLGLAITFVSICGTVYFSSRSMTNLMDGDVEQSKRSQLNAVLTGSASSDAANEEAPANAASVNSSGDPNTGAAAGADAEQAAADSVAYAAGWKAAMNDGGHAMRFNIAMMLIAMYWCMVLTDWGNVDRSASGASPTNGKIAMWMNITASWICTLLYGWTLVAPRVFPDRDFS